jgi:hypothetical protein
MCNLAGAVALPVAGHILCALPAAPLRALYALNGFLRLESLTESAMVAYV